MQINISGHHIEVTEAIEEYVHNKFAKLTHHNDLITSINVFLTVEKLTQKAEASIHVSGKDIFANADSEDLYTAIDALTDKLDRQVIKHKEKLKSHR
ncbi:ribosome-associated translation inhibitor RaiA [Gilvimarinus agarilyticus]|uniref:ribosome hibernation-promoting factor, HPF/YfiA family n=1 Tax=unclassified Gilvimarinus TaxID=2642066 RepID=UPI001C0A11A5|nr:MULTISPECIES: ribosome-associated translation inhibitor RaiA [unclassified Gilvimarinus]MBU2885440.1 ribosome-associated translation inhibitor RaiA [Gilvimarinus agarilyticus]MDO6570340.1 ribosome-associated translation inhibitor RaiA [Gilvimarinus sp. 2_MG-2023]MDO6746873.1 ribosome-associated translation inhibitor RaiA [Gilvimarinus sp. 1_MG-2023]